MSPRPNRSSWCWLLASGIVREWRVKGWRLCIPQSFYEPLIEEISDAFERELEAYADLLAELGHRREAEAYRQKARGIGPPPTRVNPKP